MPHASGLTPEKRKSSWERNLPARSYDNTVYCASCNQVGDNGLGTVFGGGIMVTDPRGKTIGSDYSCETMLTFDLDGEVLDRLRSPGYECMKDLLFLDKRRPDLYFR